jgi:hypothetical protein
VRHFMGDTPIAMLLDGDADTRDLADDGILVLGREDVSPASVANLCFGSLRTKLAALWAAPFETFLVLDADTIVWGDVRSLADFSRYDFVLDSRESEPLTSVMNLELVEKHVPEFDAAAHVPDFVNTGAFFGRRGVLDLEWYEHLVRLAWANPRMFLYGDQGLFNALVFHAVDEGRIRVDHRDLQVKTGSTPREELVRRFGFANGEPTVIGEPTVLHWVGSRKPRVRQQGRDYFEPMTYFRTEHRLRRRGDRPRPRRDRLSLRVEDAMCSDWRGSNLRGRAARIRRRVRDRRRGGKAALKRRTPDSLVSAVRRARASLRRSS